MVGIFLVVLTLVVLDTLLLGDVFVIFEIGYVVVFLITVDFVGFVAITGVTRVVISSPNCLISISAQL